jgi:Outer membrane protein beta-barrel domain
MKAKLLTLAIICLVASSAFSQSFKIGIKGGATINKITGQSFNEQFTWGYHLGGFATISFGKVGIQPEVLFNQVNVDSSSHFSDIYQFNKVGKVKLSYLTIPLLLNINANKFVTVQVGPQFGILMNKSKTLVQNGKDAFKGQDFSMVGGLQLNLSKLRIFGRYAVGLNNLNDIDNKEKWKSQSIQLGVGLAL